MIIPRAAENRKIRGICPCPAIREGDTRVGVLRVSGRTNRVYARPAAGFPRCRCFPNIFIIALSAPKEKGFPSLLLCFAADGGKMLFSVKADAFGSAAKQFKPHGCAMRRGRGGDRKAPSPLPQERNPCATKKTKKHGCAPRRKAAFPLQNQKNHKKMTIRCNEIAFSFVLYNEGGHVIDAADSTQ